MKVEEVVEEDEADGEKNYSELAEPRGEEFDSVMKTLKQWTVVALEEVCNEILKYVRLWVLFGTKSWCQKNMEIRNTQKVWFK